MLVAIAIPIFTTQLEKSRESTDIANVRSAYAEVVTAYLTDHNESASVTVEAQQTVAGWQGDSGIIEYFSGNATQQYSYGAVTKGGSYKVSLTIDASTGNATPVVAE